MRHIKLFEENIHINRYWIVVSKFLDEALEEIGAPNSGADLFIDIKSFIKQRFSEPGQSYEYVIIAEDIELNPNGKHWDWLSFDDENLNWLKKHNYEYMGTLPEYYSDINKYNL
jgi:hypothetical protein